MNFRTLAFTLAASLILASAAGAVEHKHHARAEDRQMSARSDTLYGRVDGLYRAPAANPADPPASANGS